MSEDKELVDVWRADFEKIFQNESPRFEKSGHYMNSHRESMWQGWLFSKRSQPIVVLPEKDHYYLQDDVYDADQVHAALTAAGIKYTIGE